MKTLYLTTGLRFEGRHTFEGRLLYDRFQSMSNASLVGHMVLPEKLEEHEEEYRALFRHPQLTDEIFSDETIRRFAPDLIYLEGGLFSRANTGELWKVPRALVLDLVQAGSVMIVADADVNLLRRQKALYADVSDLLGSHADYGRPVSQFYADYGPPKSEGVDEGPVSVVDQTHNTDGVYDIVCKPELMIVSDWLRPLYAGIEEINVWGAVSLTNYRSDILASGNKGTAGTLHDDVWVDEKRAAPFATVARVGKGYVVLIAAAISNDGRNEKYPGNLLWLTNLSRFLRDDVDKDQARYHSSVDTVTTGTALQEEVVASRGEVVAGLRVIWPETEKALRRQIEITMRETYGEGWPVALEKRHPNWGDKFEDWRTSQQQAIKTWGERAPKNLLAYTYPGDLFDIILSEWKAFEPIFRKDKAYWNVHRSLLSKVRNPLQHSQDEVFQDYELTIAQGYCQEILYLLHSQEPMSGNGQGDDR